MFWPHHNKVGRNEECTCGSGEKFKNCCYLLPEEKRTHIAVRLKERNLELVGIAMDIFGLSRGVKWEQLRTNMTNDQVKAFYGEYARLWPIDQINPLSYLPVPTKKLRGLYMGDMSPRGILTNVLRYSLYTDEILIVNPLKHPDSLKPNFSPTHSPGQYKQDTLVIIYFLMSLQPWIEAGVVHMIPNPIDFDPRLRNEVWGLANKRYDGKPFELTDEEEKEVEQEGQEQLMRTTVRATHEQQISNFRNFKPNASDQEISDHIAMLKKELDHHPLWLNQTLEDGGELAIKRNGANLELGLMLGQLTGSYLYTNQRRQWDEILTARQTPAEADIWSPLTNSFQQLDFKFLEKVDPQFVYRIQQEGRLSNFRSYLRKLWNNLDSKTSDSQIREFSDELGEEHARVLEEWKDIDRELRNSLLSKDGLASAFFGAVGVTFLGIATGSLGWNAPLTGFCLPAVNALLKSVSSRQKFRNTVPLSVFVDLDNKGRFVER